MFDKNFKGSSGIRGSLSASYLNNENAEKRKVQILEASTEINNIILENKQKKIILKIDCEGAEYEILENLFASKIINKIDVILLEWHDNGAEPIEKLLLLSGFDTFSISLGLKSGMIYSKRKFN